MVNSVAGDRPLGATRNLSEFCVFLMKVVKPTEASKAVPTTSLHLEFLEWFWIEIINNSTRIKPLASCIRHQIAGSLIFICILPDILREFDGSPFLNWSFISCWGGGVGVPLAIPVWSPSHSTLQNFGAGHWSYLNFRSRPPSRQCWKYWTPIPQAIFKFHNYINYGTPISGAVEISLSFPGTWTQHQMGLQNGSLPICGQGHQDGSYLGSGRLEPGNRGCILTPFLHFLGNSSWIPTKSPPF
jgi:hypothetical protein